MKVKFEKSNIVIYKDKKNTFNPDIFVILNCFEMDKQYDLQNISNKMNVDKVNESDLTLHQLPKKFIQKCS